jgi:glycosyltransferase involved in cell wall biosynthesis
LRSSSRFANSITSCQRIHTLYLYTLYVRVLMVSKALVVGAYQRKCELLAEMGVDLHVAVPEQWVDERGAMVLERAHLSGYTLHVVPIALNGNFHLHFYPSLGSLLRRLKPDLVHIDEEPYNLATWLAWRAARAVGARSLFFSWQNLRRRYPPPFAWWEAAVLRGVDGALFGNVDAEAVWRAKGYTGPGWCVPQFGVEETIYAPAPRRAPNPVLTAGFAGRFVPDKGVDTLLLALAQVEGVALRLLGSGPERRLYETVIKRHGLGERVRIEPPRPSLQMPAFYREIDALVLPSRTRPNWKEQFGRVVIEAMACGTPAIVSDSGEPQRLIGDAGLVFPEDDVEALATHLVRLRDHPVERERLSAAGRARVLAHYTMRQIAAATRVAYRIIVG